MVAESHWLAGLQSYQKYKRKLMALRKTRPNYTVWGWSESMLSDNIALWDNIKEASWDYRSYLINEVLAGLGDEVDILFDHADCFD